MANDLVLALCYKFELLSTIIRKGHNILLKCEIKYSEEKAGGNDEVILHVFLKYRKVIHQNEVDNLRQIATDAKSHDLRQSH